MLAAQVGLQLVLAAAAGPPSFRGQRGAPKSHPETRVHHFPEALSPAECESVRRLKGKAAEGVIKVGHTYEEEDSAKGSLRSTALQWLPQSSETQWLYERVFSIAQQANLDAGWRYDTLHSVQRDLQLGLYDAEADPPGHYTWHADEEWQQHNQPQLRVRILSFSVQLSESDDYEGADLQVGMVNVSRDLGSAIVFPSYQIHKVHPAVRGKRWSLVGWVMGSDPAPFWNHALETLEQLLAREERMRAEGGFPDDLKLQALTMLGPVRLVTGRIEEALSLTTAEIALREQMAGSSAELSGEGPLTLPGIALGKALIRQSMAIERSPRPPMERQQVARDGCHRASLLTEDNERGLALVCRAKWEAKLAGMHIAAITFHEALAIKAGVPYAFWLAGSLAFVLLILRCCVGSVRCCYGCCCQRKPKAKAS